jgi:hypothetical protein
MTGKHVYGLREGLSDTDTTTEMRLSSVREETIVDIVMAEWSWCRRVWTTLTLASPR